MIMNSVDHSVTSKPNLICQSFSADPGRISAVCCHKSAGRDLQRWWTARDRSPKTQLSHPLSWTQENEGAPQKPHFHFFHKKSWSDLGDPPPLKVFHWEVLSHRVHQASRGVKRWQFLTTFDGRVIILITGVSSYKQPIVSKTPPLTLFCHPGCHLGIGSVHFAHREGRLIFFRVVFFFSVKFQLTKISKAADRYFSSWPKSADQNVWSAFPTVKLGTHLSNKSFNTSADQLLLTMQQ